MRSTVAAMVLGSLCSVTLGSSGLTSIDTGAYTITKVRAARREGRSCIIASSYHGTVLAIGYDGKVLWSNELSGFMNHDLWCEDITGDGNDEVLAANADGSVYCLDHAGKPLWAFKPNDAPMYSVCVVSKDGVPYVACGGYDKSFYYVSSAGKLVKRIESSTYSKERTWGKGPKRIPPKGVHTVNVLRRMRAAGGRDVLVVHGAVWSLGGGRCLYLFAPLSDTPDSTLDLPRGLSCGDLRVRDTDGDGVDEILLGTSGMIDDSAFATVHPGSGTHHVFAIAEQKSLRRKIDRFGYRVLQPEMVRSAGGGQVMLLFGSRILLLDPDKREAGEAEVLTCRHSFNDMWRDPQTEKIILASAQSGGSCVHVLDTSDSGWKKAYEGLTPPGKIAAILKNTETVRSHLAAFSKPPRERDPLPVFLMTERIPDSLIGLVDSIRKNSPSPVFLNGTFVRHGEKWDRSGMASEKYRDRRDRRKQYIGTSDRIVALLTSSLEGHPGVAYWGGHGNDPYMISLATQKKIIDAAKGKKVVTIYPELEDPSEDFAFVLNDLLYPLAAYCKGRNAKMFIRSKHLFWQTAVYEPMWSRFLDGEFSDVFVPSMEETTDKTMELSLAARMGLWASGVVDDWGARCSRDNTSFDRLRQHSHQMLPNHFLRQQIYSIASGARYLNNFPVDQEYMSVLWSLIAKGALYVPKCEEIVSFSPVHVSMTRPDKHFADDGNNVKWTLFYDEKFERDNPFVFSRLNGTWPGAPVTRWDFSRYAAGVRDRRLNYLPPYPNGMVLITPEQKGRGKALRSRLHPLYSDILKEYVTDGRQYYSKDGGKPHAADAWCGTVERDIEESATTIPLTVSGTVAWVAAVSAPGHIRLTLLDSGYINPGDKTATVTFHTVTPVAVTDVLTGKGIAVENHKTARVPIPCGLFRFLDVEIQEALQSPGGGRDVGDRHGKRRSSLLQAMTGRRRPGTAVWRACLLGALALASHFSVEYSLSRTSGSHAQESTS